MRYLIVLCSMLWLLGCTATTESTVDTPKPSSSSQFIQGRDYRQLEQPIVGAPAVIELFYYGCRACYYLTDELADWSQEKDILLSLVPAHGEENLVDGARLFHTLAALGRLDLHVDAYLLFQQPNELQGEERINALLAEKNIVKEDFWALWGSDVVNQRLSNSFQLTHLAGISSTPAFLVQGKYVVELSVIEGSEGLLELLEYLVNLPE